LGVDGPAKSVSFFEQAVQADPGFADAYAALGTTWVTMAFQGEWSQVAESYAKARRAAQRALQLDPANAEALAVLGTASFFDERNFPRAEAELLRSIELNPSRAWARKEYALILVTQRRFDDALAQLDRAREIDPLSLVSGNDVAVAYYCARRYDDSIRTARRTLEVNPKFNLAHLILGSSLAAQAKFPEAVQEFQRAMAPSSRDPFILGRMGYALAASGDTAGARAILKELESSDSRSYVQTAFVQVGLGDKQAALDLLERAWEHRETDLSFIAADPLWDPLRAEPRFRALAARLGLPVS
jgi:serine/threonine-protein kinase